MNPLYYEFGVLKGAQGLTEVLGNLEALQGAPATTEHAQGLFILFCALSMLSNG